MGRAPCCEKMGLKKGPWSPEEDQILINYINTYGHANWRALPKHAGLLRCGKSCRLRWTNYLRPDIKRGNFTQEEEDAIIDLHEKLGNRWSAIAGRLPGRTDNEIKNVWHTHLKKRLSQNQQSHDTKRKSKQTQDATKQEQQQDPLNFAIHSDTKEDNRPLSPPQCSSDMSTLTMTSDDNNSNTTNHDMSINNNVDSPENNLALDEDFWSEVLSSDHNSNETSSTDYFPSINGADEQQQFRNPLSRSPLVIHEEGSMHLASSSSMYESMDFWYDVYARADELTTELLELRC